MVRRFAGERNDPNTEDAQAMDRVSAQIDRARGLVKETVEFAGELLRSGADADRIHRAYIVQAIEIFAEIEAQGLLAASGERSSVFAIEDQIGGYRNSSARPPESSISTRVGIERAHIARIPRQSPQQALAAVRL
jgi:hypothetical protein